LIRADWGQQLDLALADCNASLQIAPDAEETLNTRGLVHLRRRNFQAAFDDYDAALRLSADRASSHYGRGVARLRLGQRAEGRADIAAATQRDPNVAAEFAAYGLSR
jgi:lipoprotein NlpI